MPRLPIGRGPSRWLAAWLAALVLTAGWSSHAEISVIPAAGSRDAASNAQALEPSAKSTADQESAEPAWRHGISFLAPLKYPPDFTHHDYVNPTAPKGGHMRTSAMGSWDSFNSFIHKGLIPAGMEMVGGGLMYDTMLSAAADEMSGNYGRLAEAVRAADDFSWVEFRMRPRAYWHDGEPITVEDVVYTFEMIKEHGSATLKTTFQDVDRIEITGPRQVRYIMTEDYLRNPAMPLTLGALAVLPKHWWETRDPSKTTVEKPLGSGPMRIKDFKVGRYLSYERVDDYWGRDVPAMKGRFNFDTVKWDYFRDENIEFEAHKGDVIDARQESLSKRWSAGYNFPAFNDGVIKKNLIRMGRAEGLWWPAFWNLRQQRFQDIRVREALWYLFDFQWQNRVLMHGFYDHAKTYFHNSVLAQRGLPSAAELELLEPLRDLVPPSVFTEVYEPPSNEGFEQDRVNIQRALELFAQAGYRVQDTKLIFEETGEQLSIEFVVVSFGLVRAFAPYLRTLNEIGIDTRIRAPEVSNWLNRMRSRKFDAGANNFVPGNTPGLNLRNQWGSESADIQFSNNWAGVKDPAVDALIATAIDAPDWDTYVAAVRALDRVMLWNFYFIPGMAQPGFRMVHWDRYGWVEDMKLTRPVFIDTWWWDEAKAKRVDAWLAARKE